MYLFVVQIDMVFKLFAILQKYDFSSRLALSPLAACCLRYCKSTIFQAPTMRAISSPSCLRYCKSTIFQANHNDALEILHMRKLFAILQKYDFSSKSQQSQTTILNNISCLRYCKSTIFQANHNPRRWRRSQRKVVCDTAKVRFFKQITTTSSTCLARACCLRYCKSTIFQANHN